MTQKTPFEILLAEDNPADVTLVREALKEHKLDCSLHVMKDGAQAIAFVANLDANPERPRLDLMLVDMHMPKRDGEEILRRLRASERYANTPVIVMSSSDSPVDHASAQRHAALHYFRKPLGLAEFMKLGGIVREILVGAGRDDAAAKQDGLDDGG